MILESLTLVQILNSKNQYDTQPPVQQIAIVEQSKVKNESPKPKVYLVKKNDTLTKIAKKHHIKLKRLWSFNKHIKHQDRLEVGQRIKIPPDSAKLKPRSFVLAPNVNYTVKKKTAGISTVFRSHGKGSAPAGWYPVGQCTHYVWSRRAVPGWGNASEWLGQARSAGYATGSTPRAGAIGWEPGHVVYIERVSGSRVLISEANYDYKGSVRTIWVSASKYTYIY